MMGSASIGHRRPGRAATAFLASAFIAATSGNTAPSVALPTLQGFTGSSAYQAEIAHLFSELPPEIFVRCPALQSRGSRVTVLAAPTFDADGWPTSGAWKHSFPVSGCGNDTTINFIFSAQDSKKLRSAIAIPGATHAGLLLQRDALGYARLTVSTKVKDCPTMRVTDTSYDGRTGSEPSDRPDTTPWRETWTVSACERLYRVLVTFIPDATGTTITATLDDRATP